MGEFLKRIRLGPPQLRYSAKVGIAAGVAYLLTQGSNEYAIYSAFAAALVVGGSVGEDLATSISRIKGTFAGMLAAIVATWSFQPNWFTVGLATSLTTALAIASGWGIQVARVGVTVCVITLVAHHSNPVQYDVLRLINTVIGVAVGFLVSFLIWPARGPAQVELARRDVLVVSTRLLDAIDAGAQPLRPVQGELHDALSAVVKAWRDMARERRVSRNAVVKEAEVEMTLRLGLDVLACALGTPDVDSVRLLRERISSMSSKG